MEGKIRDVGRVTEGAVNKANGGKNQRYPLGNLQEARLTRQAGSDTPEDRQISLESASTAAWWTNEREKRKATEEKRKETRAFSVLLPALVLVRRCWGQSQAAGTETTGELLVVLRGAAATTFDRRHGSKLRC